MARFGNEVVIVGSGSGERVAAPRAAETVGVLESGRRRNEGAWLRPAVGS
jgi:choline dehydrogenase-like flavoprotein